MFSEANEATHVTARPPASSEWWRTAVIYQVYPRSFADANGDGIGDLPGITHRLHSLAELGVDAVWLSPFYTSPQRDAGYDVADFCDVDRLFGTLEDFDALSLTAHDLGLRVIIDLVPNHTSSDHRWFQDALASDEGSAARDRYIFRDGQGADGALPPNNWMSVFGGTAWSRVARSDDGHGQWYLHIFDGSQPDLNWESEWVRARFREILRFWLDRGVDGFRVDVAHGLIKARGLPDYTPAAGGGSMGGGDDQIDDPPYWGQDGVHHIYRDWHNVLAEYEGERVLCAEAWVEPLSRLSQWVRPDEMHQAFNFAYLETPWQPSALRTVITDSLDAFSQVGAPSTWVLSNHDVVRHATRLALTVDNPQGDGLGPRSLGLPDPAFGLRRARAASALMLALPGSSYIYQGEELGLPEVVDLPDSSRQDPTWFRSKGERYGRDGCRVPIPWESDALAYGFNTSGLSWLPQPTQWQDLARDVQSTDATSTLSLYRRLLAERSAHGLASSTLTWCEGDNADVLSFHVGDVRVITNFSEEAVALPEGNVLLASDSIDSKRLPQDTTVWMV